VHIGLTTLLVDDYDRAIAFFVDALGFDLREDTPTTTRQGEAKRWVVVGPPGDGAGILLARAKGDDQRARVGHQVGERVGFFLRVDDFDAALARLRAAGVEPVGPPRSEPYGKVAVFPDVSGNFWDLLGP
jgi:catechol 2,3-dioxygenase-like lactoylglutathione lyase family enzyme